MHGLRRVICVDSLRRVHNVDFLIIRLITIDENRVTLVSITVVNYRNGWMAETGFELLALVGTDRLMMAWQYHHDTITTVSQIYDVSQGHVHRLRMHRHLVLVNAQSLPWSKTIKMEASVVYPLVLLSIAETLVGALVRRELNHYNLNGDSECSKSLTLNTRIPVKCVLGFYDQWKRKLLPTPVLYNWYTKQSLRYYIVYLYRISYLYIIPNDVVNYSVIDWSKGQSETTFLGQSSDLYIWQYFYVRPRVYKFT